MRAHRFKRIILHIRVFVAFQLRNQYKDGQKNINAIYHADNFFSKFCLKAYFYIGFLIMDFEITGYISKHWPFSQCFDYKIFDEN